MNLQNQIKMNLERCTIVRTEVIYETSDYDMFHYITGNRKIDERHVNNLAREIEEDGQKKPIDITPDFGISDGQNRFEACKKLGCPVQWKFVEDITVDGIQKENSNRKNWNNVDFLESFAAQGSKPAERVLKLMKEFDVSRTIAILAGGKDNNLFSTSSFKQRSNKDGSRKDPMNDATYSQEDYESAREHIKYAKEKFKYINQKYGKVRQKDTLLSVFVRMDKSEGFDRKRLDDLLETNGNKIPISCSDPRVIIDKIQEFYNLRKRSKLMKVSYASDGKIKNITCNAKLEDL